MSLGGLESVQERCPHCPSGLAPGLSSVPSWRQSLEGRQSLGWVPEMVPLAEQVMAEALGPRAMKGIQVRPWSDHCFFCMHACNRTLTCMLSMYSP